ncbi:MAG: hypothetical protein AABW67_06325 [Nanoarchaeota archaeon]
MKTENLEQSEIIPYEYRFGANANQIKVQRYLKQLKKINPNLQKVISDRGAHIIFFNGSLTDNPEVAHLKETLPRGYNGRWFDNQTCDQLSGGYSPNDKAILLKTNGSILQRVLSIDDLLYHELGHCYDYLIGESQYGKKLSELGIVSSAIEKEPFFFKYLNIPEEYVAHSFENFYSDKFQKKSLKEKHPTIFKLLSDIEIKIIDGEEGK